MTLVVRNPDLLWIAEALRNMASELGPKIAEGLTKVTIDEEIKIAQKVLAGSARVTVEPSASEGDLMLDIKEAKVFGLGGFGLVRKMIGDTIVSTLDPFTEILTAKKINGNIFLSFKRISIRSVNINGGELTLDLDIAPIAQ